MAGQCHPFNPVCVSDLGLAPRGDQCHNRVLFPVFRDAGHPFMGGGLGSFLNKRGLTAFQEMLQLCVSNLLQLRKGFKKSDALGLNHLLKGAP